MYAWKYAANTCRLTQLLWSDAKGVLVLAPLAHVVFMDMLRRWTATSEICTRHSSAGKYLQTCVLKLFNAEIFWGVLFTLFTYGLNFPPFLTHECTAWRMSFYVLKRLVIRSCGWRVVSSSVEKCVFRVPSKLPTRPDLGQCVLKDLFCFSLAKDFNTFPCSNQIFSHVVHSKKKSSFVLYTSNFFQHHQFWSTKLFKPIPILFKYTVLTS